MKASKRNVVEYWNEIMKPTSVAWNTKYKELPYTHDYHLPPYSCTNICNLLQIHTKES